MKTKRQKSQSLTAAATRMGVGYECCGRSPNQDEQTAFYVACWNLERKGIANPTESQLWNEWASCGQFDLNSSVFAWQSGCTITGMKEVTQ